MIVRRSDAEVFERAKMDLPLSLRELSVASGYCYSIVKRWKKTGLPMLDNRITLKDALAWRRSMVVETPTPSREPRAVEMHPSIAGHPLLQKRRGSLIAGHPLLRGVRIE